MTDTRKHPHIEMPSEDQLRRVVEQRPLEILDLYLAVHRLVTRALPDVVYSVDQTDAHIGYGARQYGYNGWGMAALAPASKWVSLAFMRGASLADPGGLLEGAGRAVRHVKIRSIRDLDAQRDHITALLVSASGLNRA